MFSRQFSLPTLIHLCRALRHGLHAGISPVKILRTQAKSGPSEARMLADRLADELEAGTSWEDALQAERDYFPPLFLSLMSVGEQTGNLPEVCGELENFYEMQLTLRRQFVQQITWPVLQFVAATIIISLLILILGIIAETRPGAKPIDALGIGLIGPSGAAIFFFGIWGLVALAIGVYWGLTQYLKQGATVHRLLLRVPALGPAMDALAMMRFAMALKLTTEAGLSVTKAIRRSLRATGNDAYVAAGDVIVSEIKSGQDLTSSLRSGNIFPETFLQVMEVAEESGQIAEAMGRQMTNFQDEASRRLKYLTQAAAGLVWLMVAVLIIIAIFRIANIYLAALAAAGA